MRAYPGWRLTISAGWRYFKIRIEPIMFYKF